MKGSSATALITVLLLKCLISGSSAVVSYRPAPSSCRCYVKDWFLTPATIECVAAHDLGRSINSSIAFPALGAGGQTCLVRQLYVHKISGQCSHCTTRQNVKKCLDTIQQRVLSECGHLQINARRSSNLARATSSPPSSVHHLGIFSMPRPLSVGNLRILATPEATKEPAVQPQLVYEHSSLHASGSCECRVFSSSGSSRTVKCFAEDGGRAEKTTTVTSDPTGECVKAPFFEALMTDSCRPCSNVAKAISCVNLIEDASRSICN